MSDNQNDFPLNTAAISRIRDSQIELFSSRGSERISLTQLAATLQAEFDKRYGAETKPILCVGGDHMYTQWWGTSGLDGMAGMYLDKGIRPYMAINTDDPGGEYPGASGRLSWSQIAFLAAQGVEMVNHGARHYQSWLRCSAGFTIRYNGAGSDASLTINSSKLLTTSCTGAAGDNVSFDLTTTNYNTLAKVVAAFNAVAGGVYVAYLAPELTGSEDSINLAVITGLGIKGSVADTGFGVAARANTTAYVVGDVRRAATDNGFYYVCTTAGTSAGAPPTFVAEVGATTTDGGVTWTCRYPQATMQSASNAVATKGWNVCASGGLVIRHNQTAGNARVTAMVNITTTALVLYEDGVPVVSYTLATAANDKLSKLAALIASNTNWQAKVCDNTYYDVAGSTYGSIAAGPAQNNYCSGSEASSNLKLSSFVDVSSGWVRFETGLAGQYCVERNVERAHSVAAANGVTLKAFAQSGGEMYSHLIASHSQYESWRGDPWSRNSGNPMQMASAQANMQGGFFLHRDLNDTVPLSYLTLKAYMDAYVDSGPFIFYALSHWLQVDGTSGYTLTPQPSGSGFGSSETIWFQFLSYVKQLVDAGQLIVATPSELPRLVANARQPRNLIFNPKFRNNGTFAFGSISQEAKQLPGWLVRTPATPTISFDGVNGIMTLTAIGSQQLPVAQDLNLTPGQTYEVGFYVEFDANHTGSGVRMRFSSRTNGGAGPRFKSMDPQGSSDIVTAYMGRSGMFRARFTWPKRPDFSGAFIRSLLAEPYDLSVNTNIQVNYFNIGNTADINCATGAAIPSAVTAKEVAARINAGVAATAAYLTRAECHTMARAENGRVIIESPYRGNPFSTFWVKALAGGAANALATIFGSGAGLTCQGEPQLATYQAVEDMSCFCQIEVNTTNGSVVKISKPYIIPATYA
jgi:hypothetical protein